MTPLKDGLLYHDCGAFNQTQMIWLVRLEVFHTPPSRV
jgi:hypothetical protein